MSSWVLCRCFYGWYYYLFYWNR